MTKQKEEWRDIEGYEGKYQVSNLGRVKSLNYNRTKQERTLKFALHTQGYLQVALFKNRKAKTFFVHRLVAQVFISNPEGKPCVNHKNGTKTDNRVNNLEWVDQKENIRHAIKTKLLRNSGQGNYKAKFTNEQVQKLREKCIPYDKNYSIRALAKKYNVTHDTIHRIIHHKTYKDI